MQSSFVSSTVNHACPRATRSRRSLRATHCPDHRCRVPLQVSCVQQDQQCKSRQHRTHCWSRALLTTWAAAGYCDIASAADSVTQPYVPSPVHVGWEVWVGAIAGVIPFAIGSYQFIARILIQRRCEKCSGSGLVERGRFLRKCPDCGGFFPWQGWKQFLTSTAAPGNGGVLRQPRNQEGVIYRIPEAKQKDKADDQAK